MACKDDASLLGLSDVLALLLFRCWDGGTNAFGVSALPVGGLDDELEDLLPLVEVFFTCRAFPTCSGDVLI